MNKPYLVLVILFLLCLAIRSTYELLKEAHRIKPERKLTFALVFSAMCVLWASWFALCPSDPFRIEPPDLLRWIGFAIFILGLVLTLTALAQLRGVENIDHLVTRGVFKKLRHPMYVGFISWIGGWSIYHGAYVSLAIGTLGIASILWWRHLEEARLEAQFGIAYRQYRSKTWF